MLGDNEIQPQALITNYNSIRKLKSRNSTRV